MRGSQSVCGATPAVMGDTFTCFTTWKNRVLDHLAEMAKYL